MAFCGSEHPGGAGTGLSPPTSHHSGPPSHPSTRLGPGAARGPGPGVLPWVGGDRGAPLRAALRGRLAPADTALLGRVRLTQPGPGCRVPRTLHAVTGGPGARARRDTPWESRAEGGKTERAQSSPKPGHGVASSCRGTSPRHPGTQHWGCYGATVSPGGGQRGPAGTGLGAGGTSPGPHPAPCASTPACRARRKRFIYQGYF